MPASRCRLRPWWRWCSAYEWLRGRDEARGSRDDARAGCARRCVFLGGIVTSTLIASLAVAPFGVYHFHNTQQFAILANLLAIPICNLIVMPAALASLLAMPFGLEAAPLKVMGLGIEAMVWCAQRVAGLPGAVGRVPAIPTHAFAADGRGRSLVALMAHALAVAGAGADRARADAGADGAASGCADRARRQAWWRCGPPMAGSRRSRAAARASSWRAGWSTTATPARPPRSREPPPSAATRTAARRASAACCWRWRTRRPRCATTVRRRQSWCSGFPSRRAATRGGL